MPKKMSPIVKAYQEWLNNTENLSDFILKIDGRTLNAKEVLKEMKQETKLGVKLKKSIVNLTVLLLVGECGFEKIY